jgi:hypothetical protein
LERYLNGERSRLIKTGAWLTTLLVIGLAGGFVWYLKKQGVQFSGWQILFFALPVLFAALCGLAMLQAKRREAMASVAAVVMSLVVAGSALLFPRLNDEISLKRLSLEAAAALRVDEKIGFYILKEFSPVFYAEGRVVCDVGEGDVLNALREDKLVQPLELYPSLIFITRERWIEGLLKDPRFTVEFIAQQDEFYAFRVQLKSAISR